MSYRIVEYDQNLIGRFISRLLPTNFKPHMREGEPVVLSGKLDSKIEAKKRLESRNKQLIRSGRINEVVVDIEELTD